ncbi:MFS transporter [Agromyces protaetiae]|uniref:MFS transporter n=2 Tax=Agromyces protaetiae TaxID=2509455 RepID=A0A4P6FJQ3_9MICO|nr:MFS transporter [Agromyces protaetiae]
MIVVVLTQIQASFSINALTVSMAGITTDLDTPATSVGTAITAGTFAMAAFILLGAKVGARFGTRGVFQIAVAIHAVAMATVAAAATPAMLFVAQAAAGTVISLVAPALTVFVAVNYRGSQQAKAIGLLAAAIPGAGVLALLIAGTFATTIGWRWSFWLMVALGVLNFLLSFRLKKVPAQPGLSIDWIGALIAAVGIILISFGFSGLATWGFWLATPHAPFDVLGISPAPLLALAGLLFVQFFFMWLRKRTREGKPRIFDLRVLATGSERAITLCMGTMLFVGSAANFLIPLYMQVVQGRTGLETSFAIIPYTLSIFLASTFIAFLYTRFTPRVLATAGFIVVAAALTLLAFTVRGEWGQLSIIAGLILLGLAQGSIVALVFNTLLSAAPRQLAGDVGAWRGLVHNTFASVGIALATTLAVGTLTALLLAGAEEHPEISEDLISQVNFDDANFLTNEQLEDALADRASGAELEAAIEVNEHARLQSLQLSLLALAGVALLAIVPATRMPGRRKGDLPEKLEPDDDDVIEDDDSVDESDVSEGARP